MNRKLLILFLSILSIGIFLRIYLVTEIPPGINRDEGSIGYTAYSLIKTGQDEYGKSFPVSFQSFGDWKLPLYMYSTAIFIAIFGLTELSVRLTSILAGIGTIILTFFLVRELFKENKLALLSMLLIAVAPWHIHLSRVESEANTAVFFTTSAVLLFLKSLKKSKWLIIPSLIILSLTYYTYAGNYVFTTLLFGGVIYIYSSLIPKTKSGILGLLVFLLLSAIIFSQTLFSANKTKLSGINIFGDPSVVHAKIEIPRNEHEEKSLFSRIVHNRFIFAAERVGQNYINSFSPQFLFISGGTNRAHNIQNFGNMYLIEAIFLFLGVVYLLTTKKSHSEKLILWWIFIAPLAASITKDAPHTNRMFAIFPMLPILTAIGVNYFLNIIRKFPLRKIIILTIVVLFILNICLYLDRYFIHFPRNEGEHWGIGYKNLARVLDEKYKDHTIVMTRPEYSPYIFLLYYLRYDPSKYKQEAQRYPATEDGFVHVKKFGKFEFREIDWSNDIHLPHTVLIAHPTEVPDFVRTGPYRKTEIVLSDGESMFTLVEK